MMTANSSYVKANVQRSYCNCTFFLRCYHIKLRATSVFRYLHIRFHICQTVWVTLFSFLFGFSNSTFLTDSAVDAFWSLKNHRLLAKAVQCLLSLSFIISKWHLMRSRVSSPVVSLFPLFVLAADTCRVYDSVGCREYVGTVCEVKVQAENIAWGISIVKYYTVRRHYCCYCFLFIIRKSIAH